uniref:RRM domain-containing protein n=1 Tax=Ananas comosus var. bracteatus TaxID=296719 RepID=A0A6V7PC36_ANACO|nr:unnamed protein product [Ananas comosus var. bracteatus]
MPLAEVTLAEAEESRASGASHGGVSATRRRRGESRRWRERGYFGRGGLDLLPLSPFLLSLSYVRSRVSMATTEVEFRCFVGGLAWATDSHTLEEAFRPFGEILESKE